MSKFGGKATSDGTTIHQWQFHGGNSQKWIFEHQGDGFYTIKSANATAAYYLGVINDEVVVNSDIVLRDDEITGGMEWNVSVTNSGAFKLTAKKGYSLGYALATNTSDPTNGAKLVHGAYVNDTVYRDEWILEDCASKSLDPFHHSNIQYMRYTRIAGANYWGLGSDTDHTVNIVKSTMYSDDYCIIHDNINTGYYREIYINDELKNTLNNLEAGYQEHYSWLPLLDTTTEQENAAHSSKGETDQLVAEGYFAEGSSEYYGVWAYNYISTLNLLDYWRGAIDTATAAYGVYLTATSFYYSYLMSTSTASMQVTSSQYSNTASIIDDIYDAMNEISYTNRITLSADSRNASLAQQGYTNPLPYKPGTPVVQYQQTNSTQYVRVYTSGKKTGRWIMKYSDIQGLTPTQIQSKFALPGVPTHYCFVNVPSGTTVYIGVVNKSSIDGTLQYELGTTILDSAFGADIPLP